jgi:hypothetical protein
MTEKRAIDKARAHRKQFQEDMRQRSEPPPLAGLRQHRCERYIYLGLNVGETPRQQRKAVFDHWKELSKENGEQLMAGIRDQTWLLTLPDGESFCDFCIVRFTVFVWDTEEEMIPRVERSAALLREFASATGRCTAVIEDQSTFVCADGRRIPLEACTYRLLTDADFASPKRKAKGVL